MIKSILATGVFLSGLLLLTLAPGAQESQDSSRADGVVLGTFDSRALAVAYARSEPFETWLGDLRAKQKEAKAAGDAELVAEIEAQGEAQQHRFHLQAFCAAPVPDIVEHIEDRLPEVAKEAGLDAIVSKWEVIYQRPDVTFVDVTDDLVALFDPDEQTLATVEEMRSVEPVPQESIEDHDH